MGMILLEDMSEDEDIAELKDMISKHYEYTNSSVAKDILDNWDSEYSKFVKVIPKDYKKIVTVLKDAASKGIDEDEAALMAFEEVTHKKVMM